MTVKASWGTEEYSVKSDREGNWKLAVQTPAAGYTAYSITIADKDGAVTFILARGIGRAFVSRDVPAAALEETLRASLAA